MKHFFKREYRTIKGKTTYEQAIILFEMLEPFLSETIRTWLFIKDIDNKYDEVVRARNKIFDRNGLIPENHFIASTGIGRPDDEFYPGELLHLDALLVPNLKQEDLIYMSNTKVMPNTSIYGVRFERGVIFKTKEVNYYIISGTASIDNKGNIKYLGDLEKQIYHSLNNIDSLLFKYNENIHHADKIIGYVRNEKDLKFVEKTCKEILLNVEWEIKLGKVCRPGWLVEFETMISSNREVTVDMEAK
jgi:enamine deaminase RidA (YjgF/YER057c/UK114 family)